MFVDCFGITHYPRRFHWSENPRFKTIFNTVTDGTKRFIWEAANTGGETNDTRDAGAGALCFRPQPRQV